MNKIYVHGVPICENDDQKILLVLEQYNRPAIDVLPVLVAMAKELADKEEL